MNPLETIFKIKIVIVDDEPLAREKIRNYLGNEPDIEIAAECGNGCEALAAIEATEPDLVFLDIEMPEMNGFEMLEQIDPDYMPVIVFVTAFNQYAIKAFECHALDYLLKPFDRQRFSSALQRARNIIAAKEKDLESINHVNHSIRDLLLQMKKEQKYLQRLVVKKENRYLFLNVSDIFWIESDKNYINIHTKDERYLVRKCMNTIEAELNPAMFMRISRFAIINIGYIKEIQEMFKGNMVVILKNKECLPMSRRSRNKMKMLFQIDGF